MILSASYDMVFLGLTITSSWGNGHATTYRGLIKALSSRGYKVLFLERDVPWYAENRDMVRSPFVSVYLYKSLSELKKKFTDSVKNAQLVVVGSYVPEGVALGEWVTSTATGITAFYDIDTPVTVSKLLKRNYEYLTPQLIPCYDLYLSFAGGPVLEIIEQVYGSPMARPLYCSVDPSIYFPEKIKPVYDFGYMGTYSEDRQEPLERLFIETARKWPKGKFIVSGAQYPKELSWPKNVSYFEHIPPSKHRNFYNSQRFTLNITRADMVQAGYAPSVRLFEAAACGVTVISDYWEGLDTFFSLDDEILLSSTPEHTMRYLCSMSDSERQNIGFRARKKVLSKHTALHRAQELENYIHEVKRKQKLYLSDKTYIYKRA